MYEADDGLPQITVSASPGTGNVLVPEQRGVKIADQPTTDREIILDYPGGPSGITRVLKSILKRCRQK